MDPFNDVTDEEFVPFLKSLGVETYKKSFEWMLTDPDFSGILRWLYNNLDNNNALDAREECRYLEIEKRGDLLTAEDLEAEVESLLKEHEGLPLPGDQAALQDMKLDITMQKDRLNMLLKQQDMLQNLLAQNEASKTELIGEITKLNGALNQSKEDESTVSEECLSLAQDIEKITNSVIDVVADALALYGNSAVDKDVAKRFFIYGPFESYRQTQALFRSHFDLYTSKRFDKKQNDNFATESELRNAMIEARSMESRLSEAVHAYIESKCELLGEQAKLQLVENYEDVHHAQIAASCMEAKSATEVSEQEEAILEEQIRTDVKNLVEGRTRLLMDTAVKSACDMRQSIIQELSFLQEVCQKSAATDAALCRRARLDLSAAQQLADFTHDLLLYRRQDTAAVRGRLEAMTAICSEHDLCHQRLQSTEPLLKRLQSVLSVNTDASGLVKRRHDVKADIVEVVERINRAFVNKELSIDEYKKSGVPVWEWLAGGSTRQPRAQCGAAAALSHSLAHHMSETERLVLEASAHYTSLRGSDKQGLRRAWQQFLCRADAGRSQASFS